MSFEEHFHWLVPQSVATQVAGQILRLRNNKKKLLQRRETRRPN